MTWSWPWQQSQPQISVEEIATLVATTNEDEEEATSLTKTDNVSESENSVLNTKTEDGGHSIQEINVPPEQEEKQDIYEHLKGLYPNAEQKWIQTLKYAARHEETRNSTKIFVKESAGDEDWKDNHFLMNVNVENEGNKDTATKSSDYGVITTSYQVSSYSKVSEGIFSVYATDTGGKKAPPYLFKINPKAARGPADVLNNEQAKEYLGRLKKEHPKDFGNCSLDEVLSQLTIDELPGTQEIREVLGPFLGGKDSKKLSKRLLECQRKQDQGLCELYIGYGQCRMWVDREAKEIINGPLLEVLVEVNRDSNGSITVYPQKDAKIRLNGEVMSALCSYGIGANEKTIRVLYEKAEEENVNVLIPGKSETFQDFLDLAAKQLRWRGRIVKADDPEAHELPEDLEDCVFTDAWCLYYRKGTTSQVGRDLHNIAKEVKEGRLKVPLGVFALMEGPSVLDNIRSYQQATLEGALEVDNDNSSLVYPLPASKAQMQIGTKLFIEDVPILLVDGPPGTGKTHSIVNCAAAGLARNRRVLFTSSNTKALQALVEKLPEELRGLCIDFSKCDDGDIKESLKDLENLLFHLSEAKEGEKEKLKNIEIYEEKIRFKKTERRKIDEGLLSKSKKSRELLECRAFGPILNFLSATKTEGLWMLRSAVKLSYKDFEDILKELESLRAKGVKQEEINLVLLKDKEIEELFDVVSQRAKTPPEGRRRLASVYPHLEAILSKFKVDGRKPESTDDWGCILQDLQHKKRVNEFRKDCIERLGCCDEDMFDRNKLFSDEFSIKLERGKELKKCLDSSPPDQLTHLQNLIDTSTSLKDLQGDRRKLTEEIQELEQKLVFTSAVVNLNKSLSQDARSKFNDLVQIVRKATSNTLKAKNKESAASPAARRLRNDFVEVFREAAMNLPFLVMSADQVGAYLSPNHSFDLGILDEASQSDCTVLNIVARCKQMLVVGDDKQVSPSSAFQSAARTDELEVFLPSIPAKKKLLPESSFFDCFKVAFPDSSVFLNEHFRSVPGVIGISNDLFYNDRLVPLRAPINDEALEHIRVKGAKTKKTNEVEAKKVAEYVHKIIKRAAQGQGPVETIGIGSMGGQEQCKLLQKYVAEKIDPLREGFGSSIVDRHNIMHGVPSQFQGGERDVMIWSCVHSAIKKAEITPDDEKKWNVAMTRARNKLVLVHSFDRKHLTNPADIRIKVLDKFLNYGKKSGADLMEDTQDTPPTGRSNVEQLLISELTGHGFKVSRTRKGHIWEHSLFVSAGKECSASALILLENAGETEEAWEKQVDQQLSLERAGRTCLRVDFLSLAINFRETIQNVIAFLVGGGVCVAEQVSTPKDSVLPESKSNSERQKKPVEESRATSSKRSSKRKRGDPR